MTTAFITGSGTGIGKTLLVEALARELARRGRRVAALKPVMSGFEPAEAAGSDAGRLLAAIGEPVDPAALDCISPWRFRAPLSPHMAAEAEGRAIDFAALVGFCRAAMARAAADGATLLIEGVGGVLVPLTRRETVLDWIEALGAPAILVGGSYLGALSHTLAAAAALRARGIRLLSVVVSESAPDSVGLAATQETIGDFLPGIPVVGLPRISGPGEAPPLAEACLGPGRS